MYNEIIDIFACIEFILINKINSYFTVHTSFSYTVNTIRYNELLKQKILVNVRNVLVAYGCRSLCFALGCLTRSSRTPISAADNCRLAANMEYAKSVIGFPFRIGIRCLLCQLHDGFEQLVNLIP